ncbi:MAG: cytidine deaminase [Ignavibacteria bacterium]
MDYIKLAKKAVEAKKNAYAPYSKFNVGAALLSEDGTTAAGCNIENSSYGLTVCAERVAVFNSYSEGKRKFKAMAIASDDPGFCPPCGACRQVIYELCGDIDIILVNHDQELKILKISELLPLPFNGSKLK